MTRTILKLLLLCALLGGSAAAEDIYTLDNGLRVVLHRMPGTGTVSGRLTFFAGSADEADESEYGMAHLLEHLLVKSPSSNGKGPVKYQVEDQGGDINAFTSKDITCYTIDLPAEAALQLPGWLVDQPANALFLPEELDEEKEIVAEEINQSLDRPNSLLSDTALAAFWGADHPFAHPILGTAKSVRGVLPERLRAFHNRLYRPDNAVLIIVGDFEPAAMNHAIQEQAGAWKRPQQPLPARVIPPAPAHVEPVVHVVQNPRATAVRALLLFPGYDADHPLSAPADLLASVLSGGQSSRLDERVKRAKDLVTGVSAYSVAYAGCGYVGIWLETEPEKADQIVPAVEETFGVIENVFYSRPDAEELERARTLCKANQTRSEDTVSDFADLINSYVAHGGGWRMRALYGAQLDNVDEQQLLAAARDVFGRGKACITLLVPQADTDEQERWTRELGELAQKLALRSATAPADQALPAFVELEPLGCGARMIAMKDPSRGMVRIEAAVRGGLLEETPATNGMYALMARAWAKASALRPAEVLSRDLERLGASISGASGVYTFRLSGEFMRDNWREALEVFTEVFTQPVFDENDVAEARREQLAVIGARRENLFRRTRNLSDKEFYPGHPYGMDSAGTKENVERFTDGQIMALCFNSLASKDIFISIAGDIDLQEARTILDRGLARINRNADRGSVKLPAVPRVPEKTSVVREDMKTAQTHIIITFPGVPADSPKRPALELLCAWLGGMSGPLFRELREQARLAYTVFPFNSIYADAGDMKWYISCEASKAQQALDGMRAILERVRTNGITVEDAEAAKRTYIGGYRIANQSLGTVTLQTLTDVMWGRGLDFRAKYMEQVKACTADDISAAAREFLDLEHAGITVLGGNTDVTLQ